MIETSVIDLTKEALALILLLAGPSVIVAALVGLLIAFVQAATQIQEQSFQYAAKFFAVVLTIFLTASITGASLYQYTNKLFSEFPTMVDSR